MDRSILAFVVLLSACVSLSAQWLHYPTPGIPRTPEGVRAATPGLAAFVGRILCFSTDCLASNADKICSWESQEAFEKFQKNRLRPCRGQASSVSRRYSSIRPTIFTSELGSDPCVV